MCIGAAHAEGIYARAARALVRNPRTQRVIDLKWAAFEIDRRIGPLVAQAGRQLSMLERQRHLDEAGRTRSGVEVADVGLDRADAAEARFRRGFLKGLRQCSHFDRVAQVGAGAMAFHVVDGVCAHACHSLRFGNRLGLAIHAGRQVARLGGTVVVDGRALDDGPDVIAVAQRIVQPPEHHHARARSEHRALGAMVEGMAMAIGRQDLALLKDVAARMGQLDGHASGQSHVALATQQGLAGVVHRHQRGGAGGLNVDAGPLEVKDVADPGREEVLVVAGVAQQEHAGVCHQIRVRADVEVEVAAHAAAGIDGYGAGKVFGGMAGIFKRLPGHFQKLAVLRVHDGRFLRAEAEEVRVELLESVEHSCGGHVVAVPHALRALAGGEQLGFCQSADGFDALAQVGPVGCRIGRTRQVR